MFSWLKWLQSAAMTAKKRKKRLLKEIVPRKDAALVKDESMRIRVSASDKKVLEEAATRVGLGVSAFVLSAALERARASLEK